MIVNMALSSITAKSVKGSVFVNMRSINLFAGNAEEVADVNTIELDQPVGYVMVLLKHANTIILNPGVKNVINYVVIIGLHLLVPYAKKLVRMDVLDIFAKNAEEMAFVSMDVLGIFVSHVKGVVFVITDVKRVSVSYAS